MSAPFREAVVSRQAIAGNVARLREITGTRSFLAVVKANAYGHGAIAAADAALAGGADRLGTADLAEAVALRESGISAPLLCWLHDPTETFDAAVEHGIEVGVSSLDQLDRVAAAALRRGGRAIVQVKLETGLGRNGLAPEDADAFFAAAARYGRDGIVTVGGIFSHLSNTSRDEDLAAVERYGAGVEVARRHGITGFVRHLAATAAAIDVPEARLDAVRVGLGIYGLSPFADRTSADLGLRPAMSLRARVAAVRRVPAGSGVSYDYTYRTSGETSLALVPLGYADGIPRSASGRAEVLLNGRRHRIAGRVAMDQFVIDVGDDPVAVGDLVTLWDDPATGAPSVEEWAEWCGTINYEMVTRLGPRITRTVVDA